MTGDLNMFSSTAAEMFVPADVIPVGNNNYGSCFGSVLAGYVGGLVLATRAYISIVLISYQYSITIQMYIYYFTLIHYKENILYILQLIERLWDTW